MHQKVYFLKIALFNVMERIILMEKNGMTKLEHGNILLRVYDIQYFKKIALMQSFIFSESFSLNSQTKFPFWISKVDLEIFWSWPNQKLVRKTFVSQKLPPTYPNICLMSIGELKPNAHLQNICTVDKTFVFVSRLTSLHNKLSFVINL